MGLFTLVVLCTTFAVSSGFLPTYNPKLLEDDPAAFLSTTTNQEMTRDALVAVITDEVGAGDPPVHTNVFRKAVQQFVDGVAEIDSPWRMYSAQEHVDSEKIYDSHNLIKTLSRTIRDAIREGRIDDARRLTGNALYTLQAFYSHSNWIEMGNTAPHPQFGQDQSNVIDNTAGPWDKSCWPCVTDSTTDCVGNSDPADLNNLLTTGYFSTTTSSRPFKPADKCSHGGPDDRTGQVEQPLGGINKDTHTPAWSPHSRFHEQAVEVATAASIQYIKNIRDQADPSSSITNEQFHEYLGLAASYTLCFVIDTTGSMEDEIVAVRLATIKMVNDTSSGQNKPGDYVLVPFNDPDYGPSMKTQDPDEMIRWLSALTAWDGGDTPELAMNGILLAIEAVSPSSACYIYTDAPAKDADLYPLVQTQALLKNVQLDFMLTILPGLRSQNQNQPLPRSQNQPLPKRQKRSPYSYYDDLAKATGGSVYELSNSNIQDATDAVLATGSRTQKVTLFIGGSIASQFQFYVDSTLDSIVLQLSGYVAVSELRAPGGNPYTNFSIVLSTIKSKMYNLRTLAPGLWTVILTNVTESVLVTGSSLVNFDYKFTTVSEGAHGGYQKISGIPVSGSSYYIQTDLYGGVDPSTGASTNNVANMTSLQVIALNGAVLSTQPLLQLVPAQAYVTNAFTLSSSAFNLAIFGFDSNGNIICRYDQGTITPALTSIFLQITENSTFKMSPGESVVICIDVANYGSPATWYMRISDTEGYYRGSTPISIFLSTNTSTTQCLTFSSPSTAAFGQVSTATVTIGGASVTSVDNYLVFQMTTEDLIPPSVNDTAVDPVEDCSTISNCAYRHWTTKLTVQDFGSGLLSVAVQPLSTNTGSAIDGDYIFVLDSFNISTTAIVSGTYKASCCGTTGVVRAVDVFGNVNAVTIGLPIATIP